MAYEPPTPGPGFSRALGYETASCDVCGAVVLHENRARHISWHAPTPDEE